MSERYQEFLARKFAAATPLGFELAEADVNPLLKPHQKDIVRWAVHKGRAAIFAAFGLGKSFMQIEILRALYNRHSGCYLIICPLGVRQEFFRDAAKLGVTFTFIRRSEEVLLDGFYLTNYESVRDGKLDVNLFTGVSLDEAAVLRGFGGTKTFREFMRMFEGAGPKFKFVATATPSPNEYIELLAYAAFLEVMDVGQAKTRFFKRNSEKADTLTIHPHKQKEFWLWVSTWAIFLQKPSDLCRCICHVGKNSSGSGSGGSSRSLGSQASCETEHGSAFATAETRSSSAPATYSAESFSAADVLDQSTAAKELEPTQSGAGSSIAVPGAATRTGQIMADAASPSANGGSHSQTSLPTWESHPKAAPSTASTMTGITSPEIVDGPLAPNKLKTEESGEKKQGQGERSWCDNCRCDEGYELPPMEVHWHELPSTHTHAGEENSGQGRLLRNSAINVQNAAREKRESLDARVETLLELRALDPAAHRLIWHDLESERDAIEKAIPHSVSVYGAQKLEQREKAIIEFSDGKIQELAGKPSMLGAGCNFQRHCAWAIFLGIGFKFNDFYQALHRLQRFGQKNLVRLDLIYTDAEREVRRILEGKWQQHIELTAKMSEIIRQYGLASNAIESELKRSIGVEREEVRGEGYTIVNNDSVLETERMDENSVHLVLTSIPFSTQYEYTPSYNDFGHTDSNQHFFEQLDFLTPNLFRVLQPGRVAAIHVKDRIVPGGLSGYGFQTVYPFHADCIAHYTKHGFAFLGMKTIVTDVVRENNQTYRLGWTEQCKDGSRMGAGMPEYLLIFRKPPTDMSNGYADVPVVKAKQEYSRSRWQIDAHGYMRSSGNRLLTEDDLRGIPHEKIFKLFKQYSLTQVYDYEHHVALSESLESCVHCAHIHTGDKRCGKCECTRNAGILPTTFMLLQPQSWSEEVWTDVARMLSLNSAQSAAGREMHLCPMQFDIADRVIRQFTMPGETVFDPFAGIGTVPYRAVLLDRKGYGSELSSNYFRDMVLYCKTAAAKRATPTLFDTIEEAEGISA